MWNVELSALPIKNEQLRMWNVECGMVIVSPRRMTNEE